ncbi:MAG: hypothetical protein Q8J62_05700 [Candidatus Cloacimonadaceae bacterium]|nr:hypothetical protein [Candidatus Cloacimonadaceae bacterium]
MYPSLKLTDKHIILDIIETWPESIIALLEKNREIVKSYIDEENRVELLSREDVEIRCFPPLNPHKWQFRKIDQQIHNILKAHSFVGFHATRLTQTEISNIIRDGLQPLTCELVITKIDILIQNNHINARDAELIIHNNSAQERYREGIVCLFHCNSTLKDSGGLNDLFSYWGGEAIYRHFKDNTTPLDLKQIGKPCIVVCSLPGNEMNTIPSTSERMISYWNSLKNSEPTCFDFDHFVKHKVEVIKVISAEDDLFNLLTNYSC